MPVPSKYFYGEEDRRISHDVFSRKGSGISMFNKVSEAELLDMEHKQTSTLRDTLAAVNIHLNVFDLSHWTNALTGAALHNLALEIRYLHQNTTDVQTSKMPRRTAFRKKARLFVGPTVR